MNEMINLREFKQICGGGRCPKILLKKNGDALVQGGIVETDVLRNLNVPSGENVVFLPGEVVKEFIKNYLVLMD